MGRSRLTSFLSLFFQVLSIIAQVVVAVAAVLLFYERSYSSTTHKPGTEERRVPLTQRVRNAIDEIITRLLDLEFRLISPEGDLKRTWTISRRDSESDSSEELETRPPKANNAEGAQNSRIGENGVYEEKYMSPSAAESKEDKPESSRAKIDSTPKANDFHPALDGKEPKKRSEPVAPSKTADDQGDSTLKVPEAKVPESKLLEPQPQQIYGNVCGGTLPAPKETKGKGRQQR